MRNFIFSLPFIYLYFFVSECVFLHHFTDITLQHSRQRPSTTYNKNLVNIYKKYRNIVNRNDEEKQRILKTLIAFCELKN